MKSLVYANKPQTVEDLKMNITSVINEIEVPLWQKVMANWTSRIHATIRSRGGHLNDVVVFHTQFRKSLKKY